MRKNPIRKNRFLGILGTNVSLWGGGGGGGRGLSKKGRFSGKNRFVSLPQFIPGDVVHSSYIDFADKTRSINIAAKA